MFRSSSSRASPAVEIAPSVAVQRHVRAVAVPMPNGAMFYTREWPFLPFAQFAERKLVEQKFRLYCVQQALRLMGAHLEGSA